MNILVAGDYCPQNRVAQSFDNDEFSLCLSEIKPILENVDYSIVNFESPITKGGEKTLQKFGPNLRCSSKAISAIKWVGFNCVTLANNHFLDYGEEGVCNTLEELRIHSLDYVGGGQNLSDASKILYKIIEGETLAIINCCEHEFSIASENSAGSNPLNPVQQYYAIQDAKQKADRILLIVHGGHEHYQLPSPRMKETYRFFIDAGADVVVNHHQHCFSGYEVYKNKPIFYGIGNFCFDKRECDKQWTEGYCVIIEFNNSVNFKLIPYIQCRDSAKVSLMKGDDLLEFDSELDHLNKIIANHVLLNKHFEDLSRKMQKALWSSYEPYSGKVLNHLFAHGFLPSLFGKSRKIKALNFVECESYHDLMIDSLKKQTK